MIFIFFTLGLQQFKKRLNGFYQFFHLISQKKFYINQYLVITAAGTMNFFTNIAKLFR